MNAGSDAVPGHNLAVLGCTTADVAAEEEDCRVVEGRSGLELFVKDSGSAWLRVHSARDPLGEARRWLDAELCGEPMPEVVMLLGCGLGYAVDAIEERAPDTVILAVEPSPRLARLFLERRDRTAHVSAGRLLLFVGPGYEASPAAAARLAACKTEPRRLTQPVLARAWPERLAAAGRAIERRRFGLVANAAARERFAAPYLLNTLANVPALLAEGNVADLDGAFAGQPVFVVAAGPSLDDNLPVLAAVRQRGVLVCVDTALGPLTRAGLFPDLVVAVDPSAMNARHLSAGPVDARTFLAAESSLDRLALRRFRGRTFFYRVADHHPWPWLLAHGVERGRLDAWGSVLVTALDLAYRMGGDPVILFGADLAFTGGLTHTSGVAHEEIWALHGYDRDLQSRQTLSAAPLLTAESLHGTPVQTSPHLLEFRDAVLDRLPPGRRVLNATGAGLLHGRGLDSVDPIDTLAQAGPLLATGTLTERHGRCASRSRSLKPVDHGTRQRWLDEVPRLSPAMLAFLDAPSGEAARPDAGGGAVVRLEAAVTAAAHAAIARREPPAWARGRLLALPLPGGSVAACLQSGRQALARLGGEERLVAGLRPAAHALLRLFGGAAPASVLFEVPFSAAGALADLETCLAHLAARVPVPGNPFVWPMWPFRLTLGPDAEARAQPLPWGQASTLTQSATPDESERLARWLIALAYARAEALAITHAVPDRAATTFADLLFLIYQCVAGSSPRGPASVVLNAAESCARSGSALLHAGVEPWMLSRAITGSLVFDPKDGAAGATRDQAGHPTLRLQWPPTAAGRDPRTCFYDAMPWRAEVVDLNDRGLPPCGHVAALDDRTVLATPYGATRGWLVCQDGQLIEDEVSWPLSISGVVVGGGQRVAWGDDEHGGVLAWWRNGACARQVRVGVRLGRVVSDDTGWLTCTRTAGETIQVREVDGEIRPVDPAVRGVATISADGHLSVAEITLGSDGRIDRRRDGTTFRFEDGSWRPVADSPLGPCWCQVRHGSVVAAVYPHADLVTIEADGIPSARLAVYYPTCAAWAGPSLVVTNADGDVLIFPGLADEVRRLAVLDEQSRDWRGEEGLVHE